ncbi:MAG: TfoX/Sxy family protein [Deltaproteobacteria bacterium]|nr:TfoX/Sxy family protein [Deltaproteobacteria bacterium]
MANPKKERSAAYDRFVLRYLERNPEVVEASLFGMPALKAGGKAFAGSYDGGLAVRLGDEAEAALSIGGAQPFDPSGKGRPMRGWAVVPASASRRWGGLADKARALVE